MKALKLFSSLGSIIVIGDYLYYNFALGNPNFHYDNTDPITGISTYPVKYSGILNVATLTILLFSIVLMIYHIFKKNNHNKKMKLALSILPIASIFFCYYILSKILF